MYGSATRGPLGFLRAEVDSCEQELALTTFIHSCRWSYSNQNIVHWHQFFLSLNLEIIRNFILLWLYREWSQLREVFQCPMKSGRFEKSKLFSADLDQDDGIDLWVIPVALDELHPDLAGTDLTLFTL